MYEVMVMSHSILKVFPVALNYNYAVFSPNKKNLLQVDASEWNREYFSTSQMDAFLIHNNLYKKDTQKCNFNLLIFVLYHQ